MPRTTEEIYKALLEQNAQPTAQGQQIMNNAPTIQKVPKTSGDWLDQMQGYLQQIQNKGSYQFRPEESGLWQAYKDQYVNGGRRAMQDTMGQAAGLTGGYGNTYAQAVGQQQYNQYLTQLNAMLPQIAEQERSAWNADLDALYRQMDAAGDMYNRLYSQERDTIADQRYADELEYARRRDALADQRYADELAYGRGRDALADQRYADELAYKKAQDELANQRYQQEWEADQAYRKWQQEQAVLERQDSQAATTRKYAYDLAMEMISRGLTPDAGTLQAAGLTLADAQKLAASYAAQLAGYGSSGGSGGGSSSTRRYSSDTGKTPKTPKTPVANNISDSERQKILDYLVNNGEEKGLAYLQKYANYGNYDAVRQWIIQAYNQWKKEQWQKSKPEGNGGGGATTSKNRDVRFN